MAGLANPYYTENLIQPSRYEKKISGIPGASQYQARTPQLPGIDPNSIYGGNSPGANLGGGGSKPKVSGADIAGAATGAIGLGLDAYGMSQQRFNFSNIDPSQTDANSAPVYTAGQLQNEASSANPHGAQTGEILGAVGQGAAAGSAFGPIGTAAGAVLGAGAAIIGGGARKKAEEKQKREALAKVKAAQTQYNTQDVNYRNHQNQLYNYYNQNNAEGREYNVNKSRF